VANVDVRRQEIRIKQLTFTRWFRSIRDDREAMLQALRDLSGAFEGWDYLDEWWARIFKSLEGEPMYGQVRKPWTWMLDGETRRTDEALKVIRGTLRERLDDINGN